MCLDVPEAEVTALTGGAVHPDERRLLARRLDGVVLDVCDVGDGHLLVRFGAPGGHGFGGVERSVSQ